VFIDIIIQIRFILLSPFPHVDDEDRTTVVTDISLLNIEVSFLAK
jgi:hypothetical protein